ncbi:MAG: hypothetical protein V1664_02105 [Candidatus Uhrbacteria bacterium]
MSFLFKNFSARGMSLILPVLILGAAGISTFLLLASNTAVSLTDIFSRQDSLQSREYLFGCLDEYLVHLPTNPDFSPTSLLVFDTVCTASVSEPVIGEKQIVLNVTKGVVTRQLTATVQLSPLSIIEITEP